MRSAVHRVNYFRPFGDHSVNLLMIQVVDIHRLRKSNGNFRDNNNSGLNGCKLNDTSLASLLNHFATLNFQREFSCLD